MYTCASSGHNTVLCVCHHQLDGSHPQSALKRNFACSQKHPIMGCLPAAAAAFHFAAARRNFAHRRLGADWVTLPWLASHARWSCSPEGCPWRLEPPPAPPLFSGRRRRRPPPRPPPRRQWAHPGSERVYSHVRRRCRPAGQQAAHEQVGV
jgi:hypothetical protein